MDTLSDEEGYSAFFKRVAADSSGFPLPQREETLRKIRGDELALASFRTYLEKEHDVRNLLFIEVCGLTLLSLTPSLFNSSYPTTCIVLSITC